MGGEEGGDDFDWRGFLEGLKDFEGFDFGLEVEAVAAFGFDGCDAKTEHVIEVFLGVFFECASGGFACCFDGGEDSSAGSENFEVAFALEFEFEFVGTVGCENQVGMAID